MLSSLKLPAFFHHMSCLSMRLSQANKQGVAPDGSLAIKLAERILCLIFYGSSSQPISHFYETIWTNLSFQAVSSTFICKPLVVVMWCHFTWLQWRTSSLPFSICPQDQ
eukprot:TRINITY_DN21277_c0_g1_i1.p1 TRINITY_DN21277_c0_g1~~TRINITY_DN21277_c0_g1_i1.p1  ORF type:complete len:109 (-),score=5.26 TRINITY_DN21277_c0_g1_i1:514-840(-)